MKDDSPSPDPLIEALKESDDLRRPGRAQRIVWAQTHGPMQGIIVCPTELMELMLEARLCYIEGRYIGALVIAVAAIEQIIIGEVVEKGLGNYGIGFESAIDLAKSKGLFETKALDQAHVLRRRRNPFSHNKRAGHAHSLGTRIAEERKHPEAIKQADAELAIKTMYLLFNSVVQ